LAHRSCVHRAKVTIEVAVPLSVALDGDTAIVTQASALEFSPQICRSETCHWAAALPLERRSVISMPMARRKRMHWMTASG
jgi:hypothetical protein